MLRCSFENARGAVRTVPAEDTNVATLDKPTIYSQFLVHISNHAHVHLRQHINYVHINHVVPPWGQPLE